MNLTSVPIRGKRKRNQPTNNTPSALSSNTPRSKQPKMKQSLSTVVATRSRRLTPLESLPAEILESILLYSEEISLPGASPIIKHKLSQPVTMVRLFMWGFHDTWDQWFGISQRPEEFVGPRRKNYQGESCAGNPRFQTALLAQPWATIGVILQAQQLWADKYARGRWYHHVVPSIDPRNVIQTGDIPSFDRNHGGGFGHFNAHTCFKVDFQNFCTWRPYSAETHYWHYRDVHPQTLIPQSLITGPWNEEKLYRLFWLRRGGLNIGRDHQPPLTWELRLECLQNSITDAPYANVLISNLLLVPLHRSKFTRFLDLPSDVARAELEKVSRRLEEKGRPEFSDMGAIALFITKVRLEHAAKQ